MAECVCLCVDFAFLFFFTSTFPSWRFAEGPLLRRSMDVLEPPRPKVFTKKNDSILAAREFETSLKRPHRIDRSYDRNQWWKFKAKMSCGIFSIFVLFGFSCRVLRGSWRSDVAIFRLKQKTITVALLLRDCRGLHWMRLGFRPEAESNRTRGRVRFSLHSALGSRERLRDRTWTSICSSLMWMRTPMGRSFWEEWKRLQWAPHRRSVASGCPKKKQKKTHPKRERNRPGVDSLLPLTPRN